MPTPPSPLEYSFSPPQELPEQPTVAAMPPRGAGVFFEPDIGERTFLRGEPLFIDDPDSTGLFDTLPPMPIHYPRPFVTVAVDAQVIGYRTILFGDSFCHDEALSGDARENHLANLRSGDKFLNEDTGLIPIPCSDRFRLDLRDRQRVRLRGPVVLLTSHEPSNYGSWLFRALPKLHALRFCDLPRPQILAYAHNDATRQSLACCGIAADQIIAHDVNLIYEAETLIVPCLRNPHAYLDPETRGFYGGLRTRFGGADADRRIYISRLSPSRQPANGRVMQNEAELIEALRALGFDIVQPETMRFEHQVATFASAGLVVGPSGSGMFNSVFCRPGTRLIDIESEPHWIHAHLCLFGSCGLTFGIFVGKVDDSDPSPVHRRWRVNIPALLDRIAEFGTERVRPSGGKSPRTG